MKKSINRFVLKVMMYIVIILAFFEILFRLGFLPVITNSTFFDLKMMNVQQQHIRQVQLLAMGSSVALYELDSKTIAQNFNLSYYNFGAWGLQITDSQLLLGNFVKRFRPHYVIFCSSVNDFISPQNETYSNYVNTGDFINDHLPEAFYFKNYTSVYQVVRRKLNTYPLTVDRWGGAALTAQQANKAKWDEHDIFPTAYTAKNYRALDSLAFFLQKQQVKLVFVQVPIKKSYAGTPQSLQALEGHFARCRSIVEARGGSYFNYDDNAVFTDSLFTDPYHLQYKGAVILTKKLVADLKGIVH